ncbi:hypothetical protein SAMN05443428_10281 [Caloramator quimbayensis]|uniref:Uncharacterized protein n=1 Tax=Caloramator quimbayensis TaxID=1147123 RepID=A0A1T4WKR0_9CLOT|nr:hypothetical protein [Caloramator quimbayensis]SKA77923.1 hypothetical protein SAMN05443428_10281 [Caloramator quimbayensis]
MNVIAPPIGIVIETGEFLYEIKDKLIYGDRYWIVYLFCFYIGGCEEMSKRIATFIIVSIFIIAFLGCSKENNKQVSNGKIVNEQKNENQSISNSKPNETAQNNTNTAPTQTPIQNQQQSNNSSEINAQKSDEELISEYAKDFIIKVIKAWNVKNVAKSEFKDILSPYDEYIFPANIVFDDSFNLDIIRGVSVDKIVKSNADPNSFLVFASSLFNTKNNNGTVFTYRGEHVLSLKKIDNKIKLERIVQWNYFDRTY